MIDYIYIYTFFLKTFYLALFWLVLRAAIINYKLLVKIFMFKVL